MVKSPQTWRTRDDVDNAYYLQLAKYPDQDGILEIVPCMNEHEETIGCNAVSDQAKPTETDHLLELFKEGLLLHQKLDEWKASESRITHLSDVHAFMFNWYRIQLEIFYTSGKD